ncbi:MAG TPA: superoxide dismutase family protein [Mycobacterium sp.]|nr:superoxide dismutase family protein [Mycobacterium sp.]
MLKPAAVSAVVLSAALAVAACSPQQHASSQPGTVPPVWTGSTSPGASPAAAPGSSSVQLRAQLAAPNGTPVANATFDFANGYATVTVESVGNGTLTPGFHGLRIHAVGKCEANSASPTGGASADFASAGGVFQAPGRTARPASGVLTDLQVRSDGAAKLVTTTDAFTVADLLAGQKTALIINADPDNFGNIPPEKYQQANGSPGPDQATLDTGDAGNGVACGVING